MKTHRDRLFPCTNQFIVIFRVSCMLGVDNETHIIILQILKKLFGIDYTFIAVCVWCQKLMSPFNGIWWVINQLLQSHWKLFLSLWWSSSLTAYVRHVFSWNGFYKDIKQHFSNVIWLTIREIKWQNRQAFKTKQTNGPIIYLYLKILSINTYIKRVWEGS